MIEVQKWEEKSPLHLIKELNTNINKLLDYRREHPLPYWSKVELKSKEELKRLETIRGNIPLMYRNPVPIEEIYFWGYGHSPEGKTDIWVIRSLNIMLEMRLEEIKPPEPIWDFQLTFNELVGKV